MSDIAVLARLAPEPGRDHPGQQTDSTPETGRQHNQ